MLCPFCLHDAWLFHRRPAGGDRPHGLKVSVYVCRECGEQLPPMYVEEYKSFPPVVVSATGFTRHGKTVYLASLFHALDNACQCWNRFCYLSLNDSSLQTVMENRKLLRGGELPPSTPRNFPEPTLVRLNNLPLAGNCTWVCYDTAGECFEQARDMVTYAAFVKRARCALFLISLGDLLQDGGPAEVGQRAHQLLNTYVLGMRALGGTTAEQHLVVVLTKAERLDWGDAMGMEEYLRRGSPQDIGRQAEGYLEAMRTRSNQLQRWLIERWNAGSFVHAAEEQFRTVCYTAVSALGAAPVGEKLVTAVTPRRVLDPILWLTCQSLDRGMSPEEPGATSSKSGACDGRPTRAQGRWPRWPW